MAFLCLIFGIGCVILLMVTLSGWNWTETEPWWTRSSSTPVDDAYTGYTRFWLIVIMAVALVLCVVGLFKPELAEQVVSIVARLWAGKFTGY